MALYDQAVQASEQELSVTNEPLPIDVNEIVANFEVARMSDGYSQRNYLIDIRTDAFEGAHWAKEPEDDSDYQLTFNYVRNIIFRFSAILARSPKPSVPIPGSGQTKLSDSARKREKYLLAMWPKLMKAWSDVEINASKSSYGVLQILWDPKNGQPETLSGRGEDETTRKAYTEPPFTFRSIPPKNFYPTYRTFDEPNDFLSVYRHDPARLVADLEQRYGVNLRAEIGVENIAEGIYVIDIEEDAELIEYWTGEYYVLIAKTIAYVTLRTGGRAPRGGRMDFEEMPRYTVLSAGKNPFPQIPFWVLQNIRSDPNENPTTVGSVSDVEDIISLNKHYNEIMSEEASEIAINIHSPMVYASNEHQQDPETIRFSPGAVIPIGEEEKLDKLHWQGEPLVVPQHLDRVMDSVGDLTFLGQAGFGRLPSGATGLGMQIALTPLQQIIELKLPLRKEVLESVCSYLLRCFEEKSNDTPFKGWLQIQAKKYEMAELTKEDILGDYYATVDYGNLLPRDDLAADQNEVYKFKTGTQSLLTTLEKLGYQDPESEMNRLKAEMSDPVLNPEHVIATAQAKQTQAQANQPPPTGPEAAGGAGAGGMEGQMTLPGLTGGPEQQAGGQGRVPFGQAGIPTGPALPGTAQPGTVGVNPESLGGRSNTPPVPTSRAAPRGQEGPPSGPGQNAPFLGRGR